MSLQAQPTSHHKIGYIEHVAQVAQHRDVPAIHYY